MLTNDQILIVQVHAFSGSPLDAVSICLVIILYIYAKQITLSIKKCEANQKQCC